MLQSMTGFGTATGLVQRVEYSVEARSVNNRYLKVVTKLPEALAAMESDVEAAVRQCASRGTVQVTVRMKLPDDQAAWTVNTAALSRYIDQLKEMEVDANPTIRIDLGGLMQLPGVCSPPAMEDLRQATGAGLMKLIDQALEQMVQMRRREGAALHDDLTANCDAVTKYLDVIAGRTGVIVQEYQQRLTKRVQDLLAAEGATLDPDALAREVALFADRSDVAEEISRLREHVAAFVKACETREAIGRKLDFIAQEMLREANTIASKANDSETARQVVDIKTAIDRIKEQVQNVE